jgi:hypothetical protein
MVSKKVLADDIVNIRAARGPDEKKGEKHPPLIVSIPRSMLPRFKRVIKCEYTRMERKSISIR